MRIYVIKRFVIEIRSTIKLYKWTHVCTPYRVCLKITKQKRINQTNIFFLFGYKKISHAVLIWMIVIKISYHRTSAMKCVTRTNFYNLNCTTWKEIKEKNISYSPFDDSILFVYFWLFSKFRFGSDEMFSEMMMIKIQL